MPKITLSDIAGKPATEFNLSTEWFGAPINQQLMAQAVRVYLSNQRQAPAQTKSRSQVRASGRKLYRQKGTGRARHGAKSAPIFVGGGVAHGPTNAQHYKLKMPVKMKQRSLASALSHKLSQGQLKLVEGINKIEPKTKRGAGLLANLSLDPKQKVTLVLAHKDPQVERAFQNIPEVMIIYVAMLNTYAVLNGGVLVFTKEAAESLGVPTVARKSVAVEPKSATKKQPAGKKKPAAKK